MRARASFSFLFYDDLLRLHLTKFKERSILYWPDSTSGTKVFRGGCNPTNLQVGREAVLDEKYVKTEKGRDLAMEFLIDLKTPHEFIS